jgi:hypothetical protein
MAENLHSLGRAEEARAWFESAYRLVAQDASEVGTERLDRLEKLSGASNNE